MAAQIRDPDVPAAALLLGAGARGLVAEHVAGERGSLAALRPAQALYRPRRSLSMLYRARVDWPGVPGTDELVAAVASAGGVAVWRYPHDPRLPAARELAEAERARALCERAGLAGGGLELDLRAYRPGRRAVVAAAAGGARAYLKLVRPGRARALERRLAALAERLPVPACTLCDDALGVVALEALPGATLRARLRDRSAALPDGGELVELLDRLGATPLDAPRSATAVERARRHARLLGVLLPRQAARVERLVRALGDDPPERLVTVHGDLYESQLLVGRAGDVVGLVDVDGAGPGHASDDLASLVGRVWTPGRGAPARRTRYAEHLFESFSARCDPRELARRVAAIVLGRATGPFRGQQPDWRERALARIELAERWLAAAPAGEPPR